MLVEARAQEANVLQAVRADPTGPTKFLHLAAQGMEATFHVCLKIKKIDTALRGDLGHAMYYPACRRVGCRPGEPVFLRESIGRRIYTVASIGIGWLATTGADSSSAIFWSSD